MTHCLADMWTDWWREETGAGPGLLGLLVGWGIASFLAAMILGVMIEALTKRLVRPERRDRITRIACIGIGALGALGFGSLTLDATSGHGEFRGAAQWLAILAGGFGILFLFGVLVRHNAKQPLDAPTPSATNPTSPATPSPSPPSTPPSTPGP